MITLSENARKELEAYFADKERQTIRVYLAPGGCSGPRLVLALDEPGDEDARFEQDGFAFCINKELLQQVKSVSIDLSYLGFTVTPEVPLPSSGGSSCGGCCGSADTSCGTSCGCGTGCTNSCSRRQNNWRCNHCYCTRCNCCQKSTKSHFFLLLLTP